jgi:hypothetical protein
MSGLPPLPSFGVCGARPTCRREICCAEKFGSSDGRGPGWGLSPGAPAGTARLQNVSTNREEWRGILQKTQEEASRRCK